MDHENPIHYDIILDQAEREIENLLESKKRVQEKAKNLLFLNI